MYCMHDAPKQWPICMKLYNETVDCYATYVYTYT